MYISEGITPYDLEKGFREKGSYLKIPTNFFKLVHDYFEDNKNTHTQDELEKLHEFVHDLPPTKLVFYEDSFQEEMDVDVLKRFEFEGREYVVLNKTILYPTGGGQLHDVGEIDGKKITNVFSVEGVVLHEVEKI